MSWSLELVNIITQALVTVVVGAAAVYVAFRQYRLDQRQVKLEQRRARIEIHERLQPTIQAVMTLLAKVTQDEIPREAIAEFTQVIARAIPLLDDERMIDYLNTLSLNVRHLRLQQKCVVRPGLSDEEREKVDARIHDLLQSFAQQEREALSRFRDYLPR
jgi:hypothetical protein